MIFDPINDPINDPIMTDFDLSVARIIDEMPGLNTKKILMELTKKFNNVTLDMVKNSLKRKLVDMCEFRGSRRNGGYYLRNKIYL